MIYRGTFVLCSNWILGFRNKNCLRDVCLRNNVSEKTEPSQFLGKKQNSRLEKNVLKNWEWIRHLGKRGGSGGAIHGGRLGKKRSATARLHVFQLR